MCSKFTSFGTGYKYYTLNKLLHSNATQAISRLEGTCNITYSDKKFIAAIKSLNTALYTNVNEVLRYVPKDKKINFISCNIIIIY